MNRLSLQDRAKIIGCLTEGMSLRGTARVVDVSLNTVTKLLVDVGTACEIWQNENIRNLQSKRIQCDEIWSFVGKKESSKIPNASNQRKDGDIWTWVALDSDSKLVVSWLVGGRSGAYAKTFMQDVASRLVNRVQLTTDGHRAYFAAVDQAFGGEIDYAVLHKLYGGQKEGNPAERRYSPGHCIGAIRGTVTGNPNEDHISTSHVERQNLTMRMHMRRFTRLTNGFSKKVENHCCAIGLHYMFYNFAKIHKTLRVTPAMQAGIASYPWTLEEIAKLAD